MDERTLNGGAVKRSAEPRGEMPNHPSLQSGIKVEERSRIH
jgi:hypothetical protein